jgi:starch-binding outer membrane protein, SusD/RagB family
MKRIYLLICGILLLTTIGGCKKFVTIPPPITEIAATSVFSGDATASAALSGIYITMQSNSVGGGEYGISALLSLSADDLNLTGGASTLLGQIYTNSQTSNNQTNIWYDLYELIYQANAVIEGTQSSSAVTTSMKQQLIGEAEFIRAFCHFYLVNIYGNVPIVIKTDYNTNKLIAQSPAAMVYAQIVSDLKDAQLRLGSTYVDGKGNPSIERVRPNRFAAAALLARVYLYMNEYDSAGQEATIVINNPTYELYRDSLGIDSVFLASSQEAIWQLELPVTDLRNTPDAGIFLPNFLSGQGPSAGYPYTLSASLVNSFEANDVRRSQWIDSLSAGGTTYYFPYKYKLVSTNLPPAEYPTLLRLAEQYLIRAEAEAQVGNLMAAANDLNIIRNRADLPSTIASTQTDLLNAISNERRVELFTEYGHRWLDLKRTGMVNSVLTAAESFKGGIWKSTDSLYPIPLGEIQTDPNLKQNDGYQ